MIPAHYTESAAAQFGPLTARETAILQMGYASGLHRANNDAQPRLSDLELRIGKAHDLIKQANEALYTPSF